MKSRGWIAVLVTIVVLAIAVSVGASYAEQTDSFDSLSNGFFDLLAQGKSSEAVDFLFATNPAMQKVPDDVEQLKTQFASLAPLMGSYVSRTKMVETKVAGMFVYQHYFVAYERQPISVRIEYYKPGSKWVCHGLQFDGKLTDKIRSLPDDKIPLDTK